MAAPPAIIPVMALDSGSDDPGNGGARRPARRGSAAKRRRGGRKKPPGPSRRGPPSDLLPKEGEGIDLAKGSEEPLSATEVRSMQEHFNFLRTHRKILRLKVNAAEDLLLNGVKEPDNRGVCQHLLAKVDRSSVISACERLDDQAAAKLLAGIILFSADIEYVLLLLEKIQGSSSPDNASAALAQGLERIDFDAVSSAQMRRVLSLIVDLFPERERPEILLGLLESPSFRGAFDQSIEGLPEALASLVVPLRAFQAVIQHGEPNTYDPRDLSRGIGLLLGGSDRSLWRRSAKTRVRLFEHGLQVCDFAGHAHHRSLRILLGGFPRKDRQHGDAGIALALHLLGADREDDACALLRELARDHPDFKLPNRWLERVESPQRVGRFALDEERAETRDVVGHHLRRQGHWINTMQTAWIQIGAEEHVDTMTSTAGLLLSLCVPNLVLLLESGMTPEGAPYFVTSNPGRSLDSMLHHDRGFEVGEAIRLCLEGSRLYGALATAGVEVPDAELARFALGEGGALWLVDLTGARRVEPSQAAGSNLGAARRFCEALLRGGTRYVAPLDLFAEMESAESCSEVVRIFARSSRQGARALSRSVRKRPRSPQ